MDALQSYRFVEIELEILNRHRDELTEKIEELERILSIRDGTTNLPSKGTYAEEITTAIHDVLLEERPLHRRELLRRIQGKGVHVGGADKLKTLSAYLSTDDRFVAAERGEWTLKRKPSPETVLIIADDFQQAPFVPDREDLPF